MAKAGAVKADQRGEDAEARSDLAAADSRIPLPERYDAIIVGAGAAGLYSLMRLSEAYPNWRIALIDASTRYAGRIYTQKASGSTYELGAMRIMPHHVMVHALCRELGLTLSEHDFPLHSFFLRGRSLRFRNGAEAYRGMSPRFDEVYALDQNDRGRHPAEIFKSTIYRALKGVEQALMADRKTLADEARVSDADAKAKKGKGNRIAKQIARVDDLLDWLCRVRQAGPESDWPLLGPRLASTMREFGRVDGHKLYDTAFWNLLARFTTAEAFHLIRDGLGYYTVTSEWNGAEALIRFINEVAKREADYKTVRGGMAQITEKMLFRSFETLAREGEESLFWRNNHYVNEVECAHSRNDTLFKVKGLRPAVHAEGRRAGEFEEIAEAPWVFEDGLEPFELHSPNLILAIPPAALARLRFTGDFDQVTRDLGSEPAQPRPVRQPAIENHVRKISSQITGHELQKIILAYRTAWWDEKFERVRSDVRDPERLASRRAKIVTDTAIRQIYFDRKGDDSPYIMLYVDGAPLGAWRSYEYATEDEAGPYEGLAKRGPGQKNRTKYRRTKYWVTPRMYLRIRHELAAALCVEPDAIPEPLNAGMARWGDFPYEAGWHAWGVGINTTEARRWLAKPLNLPRDNIFGVCNEGFSTTQGWIEGSLRSAEEVLRRHKIEAPDWLSTSFPLTDDSTFDDYCAH